MYVSESFGRHFWVDDNDNFRSAPSFLDDTADMDNADYVSDWDEWEGVNFDLLLSILLFYYLDILSNAQEVRKRCFYK